VKLKKLSIEEYQVIIDKGTEASFTGKYDLHFDKGYYVSGKTRLKTQI